MNSCILENCKINQYLKGPDSSDLETTSGVNGKDPAVDYGEACVTYDENNYVSIFYEFHYLHISCGLLSTFPFYLVNIQSIFALYT